jgi:hypothetical protein
VTSLPLAHGVSVVNDLPVPLWLFTYGAAVVMVLSFVALGALWRRPVLEQQAGGRPLPPWLQRLLLGPEVRIVMGAISLALLVLVFLTALLGENSAAVNLAPSFVYVIFWLGIAAASVLLGNVWSVLNPWRAAADAVAWLAARAGLRWRPPLRFPARLGRWPAAALLFCFAALELAYPNSADPRALAAAIAIYSLVTWLGMLAFGRAAWLAGGEAFSVYFGLLSLLAPFGVRELRSGPQVVVRVPLSGLARRTSVPGTVAFVSVMLGSVAFDGFSRLVWWQGQVQSVQADLLDSPLLADVAVTAVNGAGLLVWVAAVAVLYRASVGGAGSAVDSRRSLADDFVLTLVPIAFAYVVAHYFSLAVLQSQVAWKLASDPFGFGWNLLGTADAHVRLDSLTPNTIWYVQVGALIVGHVLALMLAHDRAVTLFHSARRAMTTQYAMLGLMISLTIAGLWLLSSG